MPTARHKPVIGLLGGIGSGKSLVAGQFARLGCAVIDADELAQAVLREPEARDTLARWWGPGVLTGQGQVDRAAVARVVFDQPAELARLEALVHPRVIAEAGRLRDRYQADPAVVAIVQDVPLLLEKGLEKDCDALVFVEAPWETRLERVRRTRGWDAAELEKRQRRQTPLDIKARRADYMVVNNADASHCFEQVRRTLAQIIQAHRSPGPRS